MASHPRQPQLPRRLSLEHPARYFMNVRLSIARTSREVSRQKPPNEGYGLQPVHPAAPSTPALAAEGMRIPKLNLTPTKTRTLIHSLAILLLALFTLPAAAKDAPRSFSLST